jgi:hypothetical protein
VGASLPWVRVFRGCESSVGASLPWVRLPWGESSVVPVLVSASLQ